MGLDHTAAAWVVAHRSALLNTPMWMMSGLGRSGLVWIALAVVLTLRRRFRSLDWIQLALVLLTTAVLVDQVVKPAVGRARPFVSMPAVQVIGEPPSDTSFPSGHAANAFGCAWILTRAAPGVGLGYWILAVGIAYSRVYLGVHYPLDVLGGGLIGLGYAAIIHAAIRGQDRALLGRKSP